MKFIDFFSGVGGFTIGLENTGHECVGHCEFDKFAEASYRSMHTITEEQREYLSTLTKQKRQKEILKDEYLNGEWYSTDIRTIRSVELPRADCWTFGAPCFVAGTLITTEDGLKNIEDIRVGDKVLSHDNKFHSVTETMINFKKGIYTLTVQGSPMTECTGNHRFYVIEKEKQWNSTQRKYITTYSKPKWKAVQNFTGKELIHIPKNTECCGLSVSNDVLWLIGRYLADGYLVDSKRMSRNSSKHNTVWCVGNNKIVEFEKHLKGLANVHTSKTKGNCTKFVTGDIEIFGLCKQCDRYSHAKTIPQFLLDLPVHQLQYVVEGYLSGDGSIIGNLRKASSVSKCLIYQMAQCIEKVHNVLVNIYFTKTPDTHIIENRIVNQRDIWSLTFRLNASNVKYKSLYGDLWAPVKHIEYDKNREETVYNMEVEDVHSYTANRLAAHNCQDFSIAGKRAGLEGERSSLIKEIFRLLEETKEEDKPTWLIYENVKGMLSSNRGLDFLSIIVEMDRLGYDAEWQIINSRWFVPQNRERVYVVGHYRGRSRCQVFPIKGNGGKNSTRRLIGEAQAHRVYDSNGIACTQNAQAGGVGAKTGLYAFDVDKSSNKPREISVSNCIIAREDSGVSNHAAEGTAIAIPVLTPDRVEKRQNGRRCKQVGEEMFTLTAQDQHGIAIKVKDANVPTVWSDKYKCYLAIRKLTPRECFRLQGWTDDYFEKAEFMNNNCQLYKQAGNGVTINVVKEIGERL